MHNSLDERGVGNYLDYRQREQIIQDIKTVYAGGSRWKAVLYNMRDSQLIVFRNNLIQSGKLNKTLPQVSIRVVMKESLADTYTQSVWGENAYVFRLGQNVDRTTLKIMGEKSRPYVVPTTPESVEEKSSPHVVQTTPFQVGLTCHPEDLKNSRVFPGKQIYQLNLPDYIQVGEIITNSNFFITSCVIHGKSYKRFEGCQLFGF